MEITFTTKQVFMEKADCLKLLFIVNPRSGNNRQDWVITITDFFVNTKHQVEIHLLSPACNPAIILEKIKTYQPARVIAAGGDGTVKLVAACLINTNIPLGILPAGSANGLAKELGIPEIPEKALAILTSGKIKKIHAININNQLCIHLSDIGFNAFVIKKFETQTGRGMWGYLKASLKVLWNHSKMNIVMRINGEPIKVKAAMMVIANATQYGTGAIINPEGKLDDELFEVIAVKEISLREIYKMKFSHAPYDPKKTSVYQTNALVMRSRKKAHFQVDGQYLGKINKVKADLLPGALMLITG